MACVDDLLDKLLPQRALSACYTTGLSFPGLGAWNTRCWSLYNEAMNGIGRGSAGFGPRSRKWRFGDAEGGFFTNLGTSRSIW